METNIDGPARQSSLADLAPIGFLIGTVAKHMRRKFDEQAKQHELTLPQWKLLAQLVQSDGMSQSALAALIETDPMTTSGILDRLSARGLLVRVPHPNDSRANVVKATSDGHALAASMKTVASEVYTAMVADIPDTDRQAMIRALNKISENLSGQTDRART